MDFNTRIAFFLINKFFWILGNFRNSLIISEKPRRARGEHNYVGVPSCSPFHGETWLSREPLTSSLPGRCFCSLVALARPEVSGEDSAVSLCPEGRTGGAGMENSGVAWPFGCHYPVKGMAGHAQPENIQANPIRGWGGKREIKCSIFLMNFLSLLYSILYYPPLGGWQ